MNLLILNFLVVLQDTPVKDRIYRNVHTGVSLSEVPRGATICCNDFLVEIRPSNDLLETAYILVYAKVNGELPQFVGLLLTCVKANPGFHQVLKDKKKVPKRKFEILSSLNNLKQKFSVICGS